MDEQPPNYRREFLSSPQHVGLGLLTIGLGFVSAQLLPLIIGGTLYSLGWLYLPDMSFFRGWVDRRREAARREEEMKKLTAFVQRRGAVRRPRSSACPPPINILVRGFRAYRRARPAQHAQ